MAMTEIVHPPQRFQPPKDLEGVIYGAKMIIKEEAQQNPFLPTELPGNFFVYHVDQMLKTIDHNLYETRQPRLRKMETARIAEMLAEKAIDKLYDLPALDIKNIEDNTNITDYNKGKLTVDQIKVAIPTEVAVTKSTEMTIPKKKKWSFRRFVDVFFSCISKSKAYDN